MIAKSMYEQKMTMLGYITYDEQIQYAVSILEKHPHIRQAVAGNMIISMWMKHRIWMRIRFS